MKKLLVAIIKDFDIAKVLEKNLRELPKEKLEELKRLLDSIKESK